MSADEVAKDIVDAALKVHRALGPGLLESAYQACLAHDLERRRHCVECEVGVPLEFEGAFIEVGYRIDMRIDQLVLVENKTVEKILPIHLAQLLTYLKLSGLSLGLIINWNVILIRDGIQRVVRNHAEKLGGGIRIRRLTQLHPLFLACFACLAFRSSGGGGETFIKLALMGRVILFTNKRQYGPFKTPKHALSCRMASQTPIRSTSACLTD